MPTATTTRSTARLVAGSLRSHCEDVRALLQEPDEQIIALTSHAPQILRAAEELVALLVTNARDHGATWADVGETFGITRSAAQQRFGSTSEQS
jgi:hypothetical protein